MISEDSKKSLTERSRGEPHSSVFFFAEEHCSDFRRFDGRLDFESKAFRLECEVVSLLELSSESSKPHSAVFFFAEVHCSDFLVAELHCSDFRYFDGRLDVESKSFRLECEVVSLSALCSNSFESSMNVFSGKVEIFYKDIWSCEISKACPTSSTRAVVKLLLGSFVDERGGKSSSFKRSISLSFLHIYSLEVAKYQ